MKFFDFCSGIGGGRIGLENNGLNCVGNSEINLLADRLYTQLFGDKNNFGDLTKIDVNNLPDFDFLIAGFPYQPFSIVGNRKGLKDDRGQLIYYIAKILKQKKIKCFLLENVKGLINHNDGKTLETILELLDVSGYHVYYKVINSLNFNVLQNRERIYLVGFRKDLNIKTFVFPDDIPSNKLLTDFMDQDNTDQLQISNPTFIKYLNNKYNFNKWNLKDLIKQDNLILDWRQSDLRVYTKYFPTLRTGRHGILYVRNKTLIKLSPYEALLLQGFSKEIAQSIKNSNILTNNQLLSLIGNAMTVTVIEEIAKQMLKYLNHQ